MSQGCHNSFLSITAIPKLTNIKIYKHKNIYTQHMHETRTKYIQDTYMNDLTLFPKPREQMSCFCHVEWYKIERTKPRQHILKYFKNRRINVMKKTPEITYWRQSIYNDVETQTSKTLSNLSCVNVKLTRQSCHPCLGLAIL